MERIQIVVPSYRRPALLRRALVSALLAAERTDAETSIAVIDNCSPEDIRSVVGSFDRGKVNLVINSRNTGMTDNWNRCRAYAQQSSADYWILLEDDNLLEPGFFEAALAALRSSRESNYFISSAIQFDDAGVESVWRPWFYAQDTARSGPIQPEGLLTWAFATQIKTSALLVRNVDALRGLPLFRPEHYFCHDLSALCEFSVRARHGSYCATPLMRYYINPVSITKKTSKQMVTTAEMIRATRFNLELLLEPGANDLSDWRAAMRDAPTDRLLIVALACGGGSASLGMLRELVAEELATRAHERHWRRAGNAMAGKGFWRAIAWAGTGLRIGAWRDVASSDYTGRERK